MLDRLNLIDVLFGERVPRGCIFYFWVTSTQDATQQPQGRISLFTDVIDMRIPVEIFCHCDFKVFWNPNSRET